MKHVLVALAVSMLSGVALAADVGVSISVGQPGFYGRIDIGDFPRPQLVYPQPVIITPPPVVVHEAPLYLHVPPGHTKNWRKHCGRYNACGRQVYFIEDRWYNDVYVPRYRERYVRYDGPRHAPPPPGRNDGRYERWDDRRDDRRDYDRPGDNGKGHSKGKGRKDD